MKDQWQGIHAGASDVNSDDAFDANGVSFFIDSELRRRPGLLKLCAIAGRAIGAFRSSINGVFLVFADTSGNVKAINLAAPTTILTLITGYNATNIPSFTYCNGRLYVTNNFDQVYVWNGVAATMVPAGLAAPSAAAGAPVTSSGSCSVGLHLLRYRYLDNTSPASTYRSNVSPILSQTITTAADALLLFGIGTSVTTSTPIVRSVDTKATTIQLEMTAAAGSVYYVTGTANNAATSISVSVTDANLELNELGGLYDSGNTLTTDDLGTGNEQPPLGSIIATCRDYVFLGGDDPYALTGMTVTNNSATITGTGFSANWNQRKVIRIGTDAVSYLINSATATTITLVNVYAGSTVVGTATGSVYSQNPNQIYWTAYIASRGAVMPESYRAAVRARNVLNGTGDTLRGMIEFNGDLLLLGRFTSQRLVFVDDPGNGELDVLSGQFGVWNQRCLIQVEGQLYGWGPNGAWTTRGGMPEWISRDIDAMIAADSTTTEAVVYTTLSNQFHGAYDPATKTIRWHYTNATDTVPKRVIAYDLSGRRWVRETYRQGIDASLCGADATGKIQCFLSDATNAFSYYRQGATDGVPAVSTGSYTANTGSTTTISQVTNSLPTGTLTDLAGLIIYRPSTLEEKAITSNTASAITHAAFATAATVGEALYVGSIPWTYELCWWIGEGLENAKRPALFIEVLPGSVSGAMRVTLYKDWSSTAATFTGESTYQAPLGISAFTSGQAYLEVDFGNVTYTDGFIKIPMPLDWTRSIRAKLEIFNPAGTPKILDAYFALQAKSSEMPKTVNQ